MPATGVEGRVPSSLGSAVARGRHTLPPPVGWARADRGATAQASRRTASSGSCRDAAVAGVAAPPQQHDHQSQRRGRRPRRRPATLPPSPGMPCLRAACRAPPQSQRSHPPPPTRLRHRCASLLLIHAAPGNPHGVAELGRTEAGVNAASSATPRSEPRPSGQPGGRSIGTASAATPRIARLATPRSARPMLSARGTAGETTPRRGEIERDLGGWADSDRDAPRYSPRSTPRGAPQRPASSPHKPLPPSSSPSSPFHASLAHGHHGHHTPLSAVCPLPRAYAAVEMSVAASTAWMGAWRPCACIST